MDLTEFLLARVTEDEDEAHRAASAIGDGEWFGKPENLGRVFSVTLTEVARSAAPRHIARWDPAHVLAECEAKRLIVEELRAVAGDDEDYAWALESGDRAQQVAIGTLRLLALPYADHPDYRAEWKP